VCSALTLTEQTRNGNVRSQLKADTDQARRSVQNVRERCRLSVWMGYRSQTCNKAHEQKFANIICLMSVHQRHLLVRARSFWTDFYYFVGSFVKSGILWPNNSLTFESLQRMSQNFLNYRVFSIDKSYSKSLPL
jgi:hypothetical protein